MNGLLRNEKGQFVKGSKIPWGFHAGQGKSFSGTKHSEETKRKISDSKKGCIGTFKGKKHSRKTIERIRAVKIATTPTGSKSHRWKGGVSKIDKSIRRMPEYINWRNDVFERDKYTCQSCGVSKCYVTAHHIVSFAKIIGLNNIKSRAEARDCQQLWDVKNGVTLCESCHEKTDNYRSKARQV